MRHWCVCAVLLLGLTGCSTVSVDRAQKFSAAGIAYAKATNAVVDQAIDASLDASSERQVRIRPREPVSNPDTQAARQANLRELNTEHTETIVNYARLKESIRALEAYFAALGELAGGSPADDVEKAVTSLADRVNGLNNALDRTSGGSPLVSDAQKGAIASLSKAVARQIHGAVVAKALERDAPVIGRALVLQQMTLQAASADIRANLKDAAAAFYTDRIEGPYKNGTIDRGWIEDRRVYLKAAALGDDPGSIATAEAAGQQVQAAWMRILSGEYSIEELAAVLKDTQELLAAVSALKEANAKK
jgi:hypothetical protein